MLTRRNFIATGTAAVFVPMLTGCSITPAEVAADGDAISQALIAVGMVYPQAADALDRAANVVIAATAHWTTGSTTALINDALQAAEAVLGAIPETSKAAALIPIAIAAIDILLASIPATVAVQNATFNAQHKTTNPYRLTLSEQQALVKHRMGRSRADDLKAAWNKAAEAQGLPQAKLR